MPYITTVLSPAYKQISFDDILSGNAGAPLPVSNNFTNTRTKYVKEVNPKLIERYDITGMILELERFATNHAELYKVDRHKLYDTFHIPKKSGGLREINAPHRELMDALRELKTLLETKCFAMYHTTAFAYVPRRSTVDALKRHQSNSSNWFLKTDFSNFFGSTTLEFTMNMLSEVFPFCEIVKSQRGREALKKCMELCFLDGGLPQGTPISPMLTNLIMIPIDHQLANRLRDYSGKSFVYTRYADDILISSRSSFLYTEIVNYINKTLDYFHAPFHIKNEKTRYGSRAGSNWNLGLMLNKDNEITIGWKNHDRYHAMLNNYIRDRKNRKPWELHDVMVLRGLTNYYNMIEPEFVSRVIGELNKKLRTNIMQCMKEDLA